jgi:rod shape-determining protein MreC
MTSLIERKPLVSLASLLLLNLLLLSVQVQTEDGRLLIRSWSLLVFSPIASGVHFATRTTTDAVNRYAFLYSAEEENRLLREENMKLKVILAQLQGVQSLLLHRADPQQLQQQFAFGTLPAPVIWKSPPFYAHRLVIDGGSRQGVRKDGAVITPEGIVGRVWTTTPFTAEVELITNAGAAAGGMLKDTRLQGVVQGDGSRQLRWDFIPNYEAVEVGEIVYTSGTDRIYPKGFPIGRVVKSIRGSMIYREIWVEPFVDYLRLEDVLVVSRQSRELALETKGTEVE